MTLVSLTVMECSITFKINNPELVDREDLFAAWPHGAFALVRPDQRSQTRSYIARIRARKNGTGHYIMKELSLFSFALLVSAVPAFGNVTVSSPASGAQVTSPFTIKATASPCSSQSVTAMGYSLDNSSATTIVYSTSVNAQFTAPAGSHTLHVKSWGNKGGSCVADVAITVVTKTTTTSTPPMVPANAIAVTGIHAMQNWKEAYDTGVGTGSSGGSMSLVKTPALTGNARQFATTYTNYGGERYWVSFGTDTTATNFVYDGWVYIASPNTDLANLEMDMNQTMPNGQTAIFGFQCDGYSNTWDYTANAGTPQAPKDVWLHSNQTCNARTWSTNTWHHVQVSYSRDNEGNITYKSVWLDGNEQDINVTVNSAFALGWAPSLLTNLQVDGLGVGGAATVYLDNLTVYRW
jgi:Big-like domain-containing protein